MNGSFAFERLGWGGRVQKGLGIWRSRWTGCLLRIPVFYLNMADGAHAEGSGNTLLNDERIGGEGMTCACNRADLSVPVAEEATTAILKSQFFTKGLGEWWQSSKCRLVFHSLHPVLCWQTMNMYSIKELFGTHSTSLVTFPKATDLKTST